MPEVELRSLAQMPDGFAENARDAAKKAVKDVLAAADKNEKTFQETIDTGKKEGKDVSASEKQLSSLTALKKEISDIYDTMK